MASNVPLLEVSSPDDSNSWVKLLHGGLLSICCSDIILECSIMFLVDSLDTSKFIVAILEVWVLILILQSLLLELTSSAFSLGTLSNLTEHGTREVSSDGTGDTSQVDFASFDSDSLISVIFSKASSLASDFLAVDVHTEGDGWSSRSVVLTDS